MDKIYIYQRHNGNKNFYISNKRLTCDERYCSDFETYDTLIGVYDKEQELAHKLKRLFIEGYDVLPSDEYQDFWGKYCPPKFRKTDDFTVCTRKFDMEGPEYKEIDGKINPFYYINSKDIRTHLRSLNYEFSSLEVAWLIWQSKDATMEDRHRAWTKLIETMPDCSVEERPNTVAQESLHKFLMKLIDTEKQLLSLFYRSGDEAVFSFRYHKPGKKYWDKCETLFYDRENGGWAKCSYAIAEQVECADKIEVRKHWLNGTHRDITIELDGLRRICDINVNEATDQEVPYLIKGLDGLWFDFPIPFKKGDIVIDCTATDLDYDNEMLAPFVYNDAELSDEMKDILLLNGDKLDMTAYGLFQDKVTGELFDECMHGYMNLEYYRGELTGKQRLLRATSNFLKGKIELALYSYASRKILVEENIKNKRGFYSREGLQLAGLK